MVRGVSSANLFHIKTIALGGVDLLRTGGRVPGRHVARHERLVPAREADRVHMRM